jgi:hypothetical protein
MMEEQKEWKHMLPEAYAANGQQGVPTHGGMSLFRFRVDSDLLVKIQFQLCPALVKNFQ